MQTYKIEKAIPENGILTLTGSFQMLKENGKITVDTNAVIALQQQL